MGTEYKSTPVHRLLPNFEQVTFDTRRKILCNLEFDILPRPHDLGPVSYTHLDVYKRQFVYFTKFCIRE